MVTANHFTPKSTLHNCTRTVIVTYVLPNQHFSFTKHAIDSLLFFTDQMNSQVEDVRQELWPKSHHT